MTERVFGSLAGSKLPSGASRRAAGLVYLAERVFGSLAGSKLPGGASRRAAGLA
ncbi:hypothetical protein [Nocardioides sp. SYSU DS0651]|uniref:hypothetical protein n=1 Tax=Nocardioides sp. SYSU DS0651 TaxID=3415955 RepID=UPI003F4B7568